MDKFLLTLLCLLFLINSDVKSQTWEDASKRTYLTTKQLNKFYFKYVDDEYVKTINKGKKWIMDNTYPDEFRVPVILSLCYLEIYENHDYDSMTELGISSSKDWLCLYKSWSYLKIAKEINPKSYQDYMIKCSFNSLRRLLLFTTRDFNGLTILINEEPELKTELFNLIETVSFVRDYDIDSQINLMSYYTAIGDLENRNKIYESIKDSYRANKIFDENILEETTLNYFYLSEELNSEDLNKEFVPIMTSILPDSFFELNYYLKSN